MIAILSLVSLILFWPSNVSGQQTKAPAIDSLVILSQGVNNQITIDSLRIIKTRIIPDSLLLQGIISQEGQNNNIQINTQKNKPKAQIKKKYQKTNAKNQIKNTVTIKQSGKNNTVKINHH